MLVVQMVCDTQRMRLAYTRLLPTGAKIPREIRQREEPN